MRRFLAAAAALALGVPIAPAHAAGSGLPSDLVVTTIARLGFPTGMQFTSSGDRLYVNERPGRVRVIAHGRLDPTPVATIPTTTESESGLLGLALHPKFEDGAHGFLYVFATTPNGATDRVLRLTIKANRSIKQEAIMNGLPAGGYHHGGILAFATDGTLFVSNGEAHQSSRAQNPRSLGGKIYRVNDDGTIPSNNPFSGEPTFAYGIRNPFGLAVDPKTGLLWETENGPDSHDEVNLIEKGNNYGWPVVRGVAHEERFTDPVRAYPSIIVPTMCAFGGDALPAKYRGNFFFGTYTGAIHMLTPTANRRGVARDDILYRPGDGVVGMTMGPDGLYFSTPTAVMRISARTTTSSSTPAPSKSAAASASPSATSTQAAGEKTSGKGVGIALALAGAVALGLGGTIALIRLRRH